MEEQAPVKIENKSKNFKTRPWLLTFLALFFIVAAIAGMYFWQHSKVNKAQLQLAKSNQSNNTLKSENSTLSKKIAGLTEQLNIQTKSSNATAASQTNSVAINNLDIKVLDSYKYYTTKYPNNPYIVVDVTLTDTSADSLAVPLSDFTLVDSANDTSPDQGTLVGTTMSNGKTILGDQTLSAKQMVTGGLVFSTINAGYSLYTLNYKGQTFSVNASTSVNQ